MRFRNLLQTVSSAFSTDKIFVRDSMMVWCVCTQSRRNMRPYRGFCVLCSIPLHLFKDVVERELSVDDARDNSLPQPALHLCTSLSSPLSRPTLRLTRRVGGRSRSGSGRAAG